MQNKYSFNVPKFWSANKKEGKNIIEGLLHDTLNCLKNVSDSWLLKVVKDSQEDFCFKKSLKKDTYGGHMDNFRRTCWKDYRFKIKEIFLDILCLISHLLLILCSLVLHCLCCIARAVLLVQYVLLCIFHK